MGHDSEDTDATRTPRQLESIAPRHLGLNEQISRFSEMKATHVLHGVYP